MDNVRLSMLCTEIPEILKSGITVGEAFLIVSEHESDPELAAICETVYNEITNGSALSAAMRVAGVFPEYMLRMLAVAEDTGALELVFRRLAEYYDRQERLRRTIRSTVAHPLLLMTVVLTVFFIFLTEVLPVFEKVFNQIGAQMSGIALGFLNFGLWLAAVKWPLLIIICALALTAVVLYAVPSLRAKTGAAFSRRFSRTKTGRRVAEAQLASVLALTFSGAGNISDALELAKDFAEGTVSGQKINDCAELVMTGESFSKAAAEVELLGPSYCSMLSIGERAGSSETIMQDVARRTEEDMDVAIEKLTGKVEPAAVLVLSLFVGLLLLSVMLPLAGIMSAL